MNIVYINQIPYVTDKETFPTKPECNCDEVDGAGEFEDMHYRCEKRFKAYDQSVADFIRDHCSPIAEEDWEKVKELLPREAFKRKDHRGYTGEDLTRSMPVDHTIYKVGGLELELVEQYWSNVQMWMPVETEGEKRECPKHPDKYRRAFRVVETKEESQEELLNELSKLLVVYGAFDRAKKEFFISRRGSEGDGANGVSKGE